MGPYCCFCGRRCFAHAPAETPVKIVDEIVRKIGFLPIFSTCPKGQEHDKQACGYSYDDIQVAMGERGKGQ